MATSLGSMAGSIIAGTINSHVTDSNDTGESTVGMISTMAPMIGSMFGPWGMAIGVGISAIGLIGNAIHKTDEELLKEAQEQSKLIEDVKKDIETDEKTLDTLESSEARFNELIKGVNQTTGENVSLDDSEWSEYQDILSNIIDSRSDLYASYDAEGNIVAKNAEGVIALNDAMAQSIKLQEEKLR